MLHMTPTNYESLPGVPRINALPQGVPRGPWHSLYRTSPGASLPSQSLLGAGGGVQIVGAGLGQSTGAKIGALALNAAMMFGFGALLALGTRSSHPILYPGLVAAGMSTITGLVWAATA